jgi:zinc transporter ZupT
MIGGWGRGQVSIQLAVGIIHMKCLLDAGTGIWTHGWLAAESATHGLTLPFSTKHLMWALVLGGLSAISLPLGSLSGLIFKPKPKIAGSLTAFGGGALIAALTVELVAPTAMRLIDPFERGMTVAEEAAARAAAPMELISILGGMLLGGVVFFVLDALVNEKGGFLRKTATSMAYISRARQKRAAITLDWLSKMEILRAVPPEGVQKMVDLARPRDYTAGDVMFREGDKGDRVHFIVSGSVDLDHQGKALPTLGPGSVLGEIALLTGAPRTATATAHGPVKTLTLRKEDFDFLRHEFPELDEACGSLASSRLETLKQLRIADAANAAEWLDSAKAALSADVDLPTPGELRAAKAAHGGAPLAIWLGIMLDGIPESFVIGAGFLGLVMGYAGTHGSDAALSTLTLGEVVPYTLIAGLFLSNFPEAMSSSVGMKQAGWGSFKIFFLWFVLMIMTALGAGVGYWLGEAAPHSVVAVIEGVAAGAMLTMILSAMVPEAVHLSGSKLTGLMGLMGFLAAIAFKLFE